jgi:hypothetical protein
MEHLSSDMEQLNQQVQWRRDKIQELQQRLQPKRDIPSIASWISYRKQRHIASEKSS